MFTKGQKQEFIKNGIYIFFILLLAVISTRYIYYKFQGERRMDFNSESLDVTYHESNGDKISLTKVTPVTDSVGLSSMAYVITIQNNLTEKVNYKIKIVDDEEYKTDDEEDEEHWIPREEMRISVKNGKQTNKIYSFDELEDDVLLEDTLNALETKNIAVRLWIRQDTNLTSNSEMYYHGRIQVVEEERSIAVNQ